MIKDYYKILNLDRNSNSNDIKKAFRNLALKWHPDKSSAPGAKDIFLQIYEAYEILGNETKRHNYNLLYDEHFLNKVTIINAKQHQYEYEKYNDWRNEAQSRAYEGAKMSFKDFTKFINDSVTFVKWGCTTVFMFMVWFFLGPGLIIGVINTLYHMNILKHQELNVGNIIFIIILSLSFLFGVFVTIAGILLMREKRRK